MSDPVEFDYGYYGLDDFFKTIGIDSSTTSPASTLTNQQLYDQITGVDTSSRSAFDLIGKLLSGTGAGGKTGQIAGVAGLYSLMNSLGGGLGQSGQGVYKGYQGGIPKYTAERTMLPIPQTVDVPARAAVPATATQTAIPAMPATTAPRRPGSGGITYFSPMTYTPTVASTVTPTVTPLASGGGISALGGYSDGGHLLRGPGDGVSDSIPATIGNKQPARLADGEFVIPARIVSEIGNGSTEAGAKKLYAMMDRIQGARKKSIKNVAANTKADKYLPS